MARALSVVPVLFLLCLPACSDDGVAPVAECDPDTRSVSAEVTVGSDVVFDWSPACAVALLLIEPESSGHDVWAVHADGPEDANVIVPPVTFGEVPPGATQSGPPEALVPGQSYDLILWRILPDGSEALIAIEPFTR